MRRRKDNISEGLVIRFSMKIEEIFKSKYMIFWTRYLQNRLRLTIKNSRESTRKSLQKQYSVSKMSCVKIFLAPQTFTSIFEITKRCLKKEQDTWLQFLKREMYLRSTLVRKFKIPLLHLRRSERSSWQHRFLCNNSPKVKIQIKLRIFDNEEQHKKLCFK